MVLTTAARALLVTANFWLSELTKQKQKTEEAKLVWDLYFDATKPGPAQAKYYEDKLRGQGYGVQFTPGEKRRRKRERQRATEEKCLAYVWELHRFRLLDNEARAITEAALRQAIKQ